MIRAATILAMLAGAALAGPAAAKDDLVAALRGQIVPCWNTASLSDVKDYIWLFVSLDLKADGTFEPSDIVWQENRGGTEDEAVRMYLTVERAIKRCGRNGFDLPAARYDEWREANLVFVLNEEPSK